MIGGQSGCPFQVVACPGVEDALRQTMRLLDDMCELVGQQPVTTGDAWLVFAHPEQYVGPYCQRSSTQSRGGIVGGRAGMHPYPGKVGGKCSPCAAGR